MSRMKVAVLNAHFSANLGDGLLSDCLMHGLGDQISSYPIDLAGRETTSTLGGAQRGNILATLDLMPSFLRRLTIGFMLSYFKKKKWHPHFETMLTDADAVILGGGNLITDKDLNFPTKIQAALDVVQSRNLPCYIYGVGVGRHFSKKGEKIFNDAFSRINLKSVTVRDIRSKKNWDRYFSDSSGCLAKVVWDPGMISKLTWPIPIQTKLAPIRVGIISPKELGYHEGGMALPDLTKWYTEFISELLKINPNIRLFSNGSPEDTRYLVDEILPSIGDLGYDLPNSPEELSKLIANSSLVAAFRLHALIPAISYNNRILALAWDEKVKSFADRVEASNACVNIGDVKPTEAVDIALGNQPAKNSNDFYVDQAMSELNQLAKSILEEGAS